MRAMELKGASGNCRIMLGESISNLEGYCKAEKRVVITDSNVRRLHGEKLSGYEIIEIGLGEESKTLSTVERVYERFLEMELERSSFVIGVGGGIVCDVAGFAAATYLRGMRLGLVPSTLLAQVDASIGGKNGVNYNGYKNLVGTIRQPEFCLCDFELLKTLPKDELRCGFAEVVKHAVIGDSALFAFLEGNCDKAIALHRTTIEKVVHDSVIVKTSIVARDEGEKGERMKLNFGHTIGHALEKVAGIPHGQAVSIGMVAEARISVGRGMVQAKEAERIEALLKALGLPTEMKERNVMDAIRKDKKRKSDTIQMALIESLGKARITGVGLDELEVVVNDMP